MGKKIQRRTVVAMLVQYMQQHLEKEKNLNPELTHEELLSIAEEFDVNDEVEDAFIKVREELRNTRGEM